MKLADVCEINPDKNELDVAKDSDVSFVPMSDLNENTMSFVPQQVKKFSEVSKGYTYFAEGDVLVAKVTPCFENGKAGVAIGLKNGIGFGSTEILVLRPQPELKAELLYHFVTSDKFRSGGVEQMTGTGGLQRVPKSYFSSYEIPLPPLPIQEALVTELERYRKMIEGARAIIDNYKPEIEIDSWPVVELGSLLTFVSSGSTPLGGKQTYLDHGVLFIRSQNILFGYHDFSDAVYISEEVNKEMARSQVKLGDVFLNITGASIGRSAIMDIDIAANVNQHVALLRVGPDLSNIFLSMFLNSKNGQDQIRSVQAGASREALNYTQIKQLKIPLPPLPEQHIIVGRFESERAEVEMLKGLVARLEAKIKQQVAALWG